MTPRLESMCESVYDVKLPGRTMMITLRPEADANSFETALASIVSKIRPRAVHGEFNAYWRTHHPDLVADGRLSGRLRPIPRRDLADLDADGDPA